MGVGAPKPPLGTFVPWRATANGAPENGCSGAEAMVAGQVPACLGPSSKQDAGRHRAGDLMEAGLGLVQFSRAVLVAVKARSEEAVRAGSSSMGVCPRPGSMSTLAPGTAR